MTQMSITYYIKGENFSSPLNQTLHCEWLAWRADVANLISKKLYLVNDDRFTFARTISWIKTLSRCQTLKKEDRSWTIINCGREV